MLTDIGNETRDGLHLVAGVVQLKGAFDGPVDVLLGSDGIHVRQLSIRVG